jgi:hypothetical protein
VIISPDTVSRDISGRDTQLLELVILELNLAQQLVILEAGLEQGLEQEPGLAILQPILQQCSMPQLQLN